MGIRWFIAIVRDGDRALRGRNDLKVLIGGGTSSSAALPNRSFATGDTKEMEPALGSSSSPSRCDSELYRLQEGIHRRTGLSSLVFDLSDSWRSSISTVDWRQQLRVMPGNRGARGSARLTSLYQRHCARCLARVCRRNLILPPPPPNGVFELSPGLAPPDSSKFSSRRIIALKIVRAPPL